MNKENARWVLRYEGDFYPKYQELLTLLQNLQKDKDNCDFNYTANYIFLSQKFIKMFDGLIKTLREFLQYQGIFQISQMEVIKECFYDEIFEDGQVWIDMFFYVNKLRLDVSLSSKILFVLNNYLEPLEKINRYLEQKVVCDE